MGGRAIPQAGRFSTAELAAVALSAAARLRSVLDGLDRHIVRSYTSKPDHGDLDIVYAREQPLSQAELLSCSDLGPIVANGPVLSVGIPFGLRMIQADLIWSAPDTFDFACRYFDYNDLGNLLGRLFHRAGFKFGHRGLRYPLRQGDHLVEEILVSADFDAALSLLEFAPYPPEGFAALEDLFRYTSSSPYFSRTLFALDRRSHRARVRDRKRPTYRAFLDWCEHTPGLPEYDWMQDQTDWLWRAKLAFPAFAERLEAARQRLEAKRALKARFNGERLREVTGLEGKALGALMQRMRAHYPLQALSAQEIEALARCLAAWSWKNRLSADG